MAFRWPEYYGFFRVKEPKGSLRCPNEPLETLLIRPLKNHEKNKKSKRTMQILMKTFEIFKISSETKVGNE